MSNAIVAALEHAATRVAKSLGTDAGKAVEGLYKDTGGRLTGVIERTVRADAKNAGDLQSIADKMEHNAIRTGVSDAQRATEQEALRSRLKSMLDPGTGGGNKTAYLKRQDDDFDAEMARGVRKSHLNADGNLEPANPNGTTSILQHVEGNRDKVAKGNSPFTSFAPEDGTGKIYGAHEIHVDYNRLQDDIASGKVSGVKVLNPADIQSSIRGEIDRTAGTHVHVPPGELTKDQINALTKQVAADQGLGKRAASQLSTRITALSNTRRDGEWLIKGTIPKDYITTVR
ncbi:hypothetical protein KGA66_01720 [Actinocrinis puniceicyclus]|uniref:Uncharacterized protein n=1 Tax=Actinocrinis puniceicyclus TaxID=977794 RepID=A0A8J8BA61_9ACTN|nr:hypothetical protein [Actinocrinis puniceicyclus]MBS2961748.1 hypothetical protein [Actinocrinis puniceicyclus]